MHTVTIENPNDPEQVGRAVSDFCNYGGNAKKLAEVMAREHPTLQQGMMRVFVAFVREMAAKPYVDARNQGSHDLAKEIVALMDAKPIGLPYV